MVYLSVGWSVPIAAVDRLPAWCVDYRVSVVCSPTVCSTTMLLYLLEMVYAMDGPPGDDVLDGCSEETYQLMY